jgi:hypothetical protein
MKVLSEAVPNNFYSCTLKGIYETKNKTRKKLKTSGINGVGNEEGANQK